MIKSWEEIENEFPNKWVVLTDVVLDGYDIVSATVVTSKTDEEIIEFQEQHLEDGYTFRRTTEGIINGPISANFTIRLD